MKILLTGAAGQLGQELIPLLESSGDLTCVDREFRSATSLSRMKQDLSDLNRVEIMLNRLCPDLVVNACAYTAVDAAETESQLAFRLNADLPDCLARWCRRHRSLLLHYSTDYVFDGETSDAYTEEDRPSPLNVYGESKLAGEWAVEASKCRNVVFRTSWVYSGHGNNFVLSMLKLAKDRPELRIVSDQIGCPTWARSLAGVSADVLQRLLQHGSGTQLDGLYHYCDAEVVSWYDFALHIFSTGCELGLLDSIPKTMPIDSSEYPQAAERPKRSVLDTSKIESVFGVRTPGLDRPLTRCLEALIESE